MQNSRGFTLVEMLFSLFVVTLLSLLTLSYHPPKVGDKEIKEAYIEIRSLLEEARTVALSQHCEVTLQITSSSMQYTSKNTSRLIELNDDIQFGHIKNIYFNKNGTINQGNHITLGTKDIVYKIVFTLGSGDFYLQQ